MQKFIDENLPDVVASRKPEMESYKKSLVSNFSSYLKTFNLFLDRSTEHLCMQKFIDENLPDVVASIGKNGSSSLNVLGVGSGSALVKEKSQSLNISFTWNQMTSEEYEKKAKERNEIKKFDFIHMIQMLYFVESVHDSIKYFHSLLEPNGKLLIIIVSDDGGWHALWKKFGSRFTGNCLFLDVRKMLDDVRMKYKIYELSSDLDITECFIEGNENGELLLDFLTQIINFRKTAPADLKAEVLQYLRQPQCSREENGKIMFNNNMQVIVVDY
uniref:histamine N-methyltransferase-like isoform X2 n=1 Tax=Pristiophorus japonicus TaxID=55135 RepID=UPI00398F6CD3